MNRVVPFLLALLVAFQATWALAAPYCEHEQGPDVMHVGHHSHEHVDVASGLEGDASADAKSSLSSDTDCPGCHGGCPSLAYAELLLTEAAYHAAPDRGPTGAPPPSPVFTLERPNWLALA